MVQKQLEARDIVDPNLLEVMRSIPRHAFVPDDLLNDAYADHPVSIGYGQTISQPYIVASMTQELKLRRQDRVLEIGTGCGYQTAVLASLVEQVYSIEIVPELATAASERLDALGFGNVEVKTGDGSNGWSEEAPFDAILIAATASHVPRKLTEQMASEGRMIMPLTHAGSPAQELVLFQKTNSGLTRNSLYSVRFVPLTGQGNPK